MTSNALDAFKPIPNDRSIPCTIQRAIAEHNSVYDTLKSGKEVVYRAACTLKPATS